MGHQARQPVVRALQVGKVTKMSAGTLSLFKRLLRSDVSSAFINVVMLIMMRITI